MPIVQDSESATKDPRWIELRVSRVSLVISSVGVMLALAVLGLVPLPTWLGVALGIIFFAAFLWDLQFILLKSSRSVNAFYLFDLDVADPPGGAAQPPKLGIRVRFVRDSGLRATNEGEGIILSGAFVSPWFAAVRYALPRDPAWRKWWPHIIPVWADSVAAGAFRHLRVALKWK